MTLGDRRVDTIDFFVLGAMKAATTGMCDWLGAQPGLEMSSPKEPDVFVSDASAADWLPRLGDLYVGGSPDALRGEGSTDYTKYPSHPGVPARVRQHAPDARFVYMMRHPVVRAISQYRFEWMLGGDRLSFEQAVERNPGLIDNGRYAFQLRQWLELFPADRFLLVFAESFTDDPASQVRRALELLGADQVSPRVPPHVRNNETSDIVRQSRALKAVRESRIGKSLRPLVPDVLVEGYKRRTLEQSRPDISAEVMEHIVATFDEDLVALSDLTAGPSLTCSSWNDAVHAWTPALRLS